MIKLKEIHFKEIDENEITFEIEVSFKYEYKYSITVYNLSGDLYILNEETKITSKDKFGKFTCPDLLKLKHGKENAIKLYLTLYYVDIFFSNIPKVSFNIEYKIDIASGYLSPLKFPPLNWFIKEIIGNIKKADNNIEYNIDINSSFIFNKFIKQEKRRIRGNISL
ncbi:hypothetical protein [Brachyspira aalborgi]|jgi:hypothetical protein|uniref:Uncharacterized protein n=1 Tax=Brachyspira aalborgi TaxID=29522 RepID=A0A5C8G4G4_9SPIR|nr:hypothetical protein [Brachyspira aalborgi]TXJ56791.1 hypothetical protein EPJ76_04210 [Brachyspira aalborgi]